MSIHGVIDALHAGCMKPVVNRMLQPAAGRRRRELTAAFQWRWPHLERHAACMQASCRSHFPNADRIFPNAACMSLALRPYAACTRRYAGCSRQQQAACVLQAACMQGACISSVNPALEYGVSLGSRNVTCHPTKANTPALTPASTVLDLPTP